MTTYPYQPTTTYPVDIHVEHTGVPPNNGCPPIGVPIAYRASHDTPEDDPFYYGVRTLIEEDENGNHVFIEVPLSLEDFLNPQEGDYFMQGGLHGINVTKLTSIFRYRYRHIPTIHVCSDKKMLWGIKELSEPAPDVAVIPNVLNEQDPYHASFDVQKEGTRPSFVMEVVSPHYRKADLEDKVDIYRRAGVEEYFLLNSYLNRKTGKVVYVVLGYRLHGTEYVPIDPDEDGLFYSATTDVFIGVSEEGDRFFVLDGQTLEEILPDDERADEAERKLEDSERRANTAFEVGQREKALAIARNMLPILEDKAISQVTGLSVEDIRSLREG